MAETPPVDEKGYVIPATSWQGWWPDLEVVEVVHRLAAQVQFDAAVRRERAYPHEVLGLVA